MQTCRELSIDGIHQSSFYKSQMIILFEYWITPAMLFIILSITSVQVEESVSLKMKVWKWNWQAQVCT